MVPKCTKKFSMWVAIKMDIVREWCNERLSYSVSEVNSGTLGQKFLHSLCVSLKGRSVQSCPVELNKQQNDSLQYSTGDKGSKVVHKGLTDSLVHKVSSLFSFKFLLAPYTFPAVPHQPCTYSTHCAKANVWNFVHFHHMCFMQTLQGWRTIEVGPCSFPQVSSPSIGIHIWLRRLKFRATPRHHPPGSPTCTTLLLLLFPPQRQATAFPISCSNLLNVLLYETDAPCLLSDVT